MLDHLFRLVIVCVLLIRGFLAKVWGVHHRALASSPYAVEVFMEEDGRRSPLRLGVCICMLATFVA